MNHLTICSHCGRIVPVAPGNCLLCGTAFATEVLVRDVTLQTGTVGERRLRCNDYTTWAGRPMCQPIQQTL